MEPGAARYAAWAASGFDAVYSYGAYEGALRKLIHLFKYGGVQPLARTFGKFLDRASARAAFRPDRSDASALAAGDGSAGSTRPVARARDREAVGSAGCDCAAPHSRHSSAGGTHQCQAPRSMSAELFDEARSEAGWDAGTAGGRRHDYRRLGQRLRAGAEESGREICRAAGAGAGRSRSAFDTLNMPAADFLMSAAAGAGSGGA